MSTSAHISHMTRRAFVRASAFAGGAVVVGGLVGCAGAGAATESMPEPGASGVVTNPGASDDAIAAANEPSGRASHATAPGVSEDGVPAVYMTSAIDPASLQAVYAAIGRTLTGEHTAVKLSSGEPGSNYLRTELIEGLVGAVGGTIVECNTAYGGARSATENHYRVAADHGFTGIADFVVMDEQGSIALPVVGGERLAENLVGARFAEFDGMLVLSHFKGHAMAGFGGAVKNISIGIASKEGKCLIHTAGASATSPWGGETSAFQECMAEAAKSVVDALEGNILFVNVMNRLSVDCDCDGHPAEPKMADIGILASADPVALDQACVDLVYAADDDSADLIRRMESLGGEHTIEHAEKIGLGHRSYELVVID